MREVRQECGERGNYFLLPLLSPRFLLPVSLRSRQPLPGCRRRDGYRRNLLLHSCRNWFDQFLHHIHRNRGMDNLLPPVRWRKRRGNWNCCWKRNWSSKNSMNLTRTRKNCLTRRSCLKNSNCWRTTSWKKNCWNCSRKSWKTERCWRNPVPGAPKNCCGNWKTNCSRRKSLNCCLAWDQTQTNLLPLPNCSTNPLLPPPGTG